MLSGVRSALVVGAGIGGLTAASALAQRGVQVRVLEKATTVRAVGSGIALNENAQETLRRIGAYEEVVPGLPHLDRFCGRDGEGRLLGRISWPQTIYFAERARLHRALASAARRSGVEIIVGAEVVDADHLGRARTSDSREYHADLVVGADGVRSRVRRAVFHSAVLRPLPFGGAVTLVPRRGSDLHVSGGDWTEYWSGTRHLYTAPVGDDQTYIAFFSIDWEGLPLRRTISEAALARAAIKPVDLSRWRRAMPVLEDALGRVTGVPQWSRIVEVRLRRWSEGRVVLIGDAAHAMAPALGGGGATAMMDAITLTDALAANTSLHDALRRWEDVHRPFVDKVQASSRWWGLIFHCPPQAQRLVLFHGVNKSQRISRLRFGHLNYTPASSAAESSWVQRGAREDRGHRNE